MLTKFRQKTYLAVIISIIFLCLLFILQNTEQVQVAFLFWTISLSRAFILLVTLLLGISIGIIAAIGKQKGKNTPPTSPNEKETTKLQKKVLRRNALITKMQSDRKKDKRIMETQEANRIESLDQINTYDKKQRIAKKELSTTRTALNDATTTIFSLEDRVGQLRKEIDTKDLVEKIVENDLRSALIASVSLRFPPKFGPLVKVESASLNR